MVKTSNNQDNPCIKKVLRRYHGVFYFTSTFGYNETAGKRTKLCYVAEKPG